MESEVHATIDTVLIADTAIGFRYLFRQKLSYRAYLPLPHGNPDAALISYKNGNKKCEELVDELTSEAIRRYPLVCHEKICDLNDIADKVLGEYLTTLKNGNPEDSGSGNDIPSGKLMIIGTQALIGTTPWHYNFPQEDIPGYETLDPDNSSVLALQSE